MKATPMRLLSVFVLVIMALGLMAACLTPQPTPVAIDSQAVGAQEEFKTIRVKGLSDLRGVLTVGGAATFNGAATFAVTPTFSSGATFAVTPTFPAVTINGVTQAGAIKYGTQASVISGTTIAHGVGTTPTMFMVADEGPHSTYYTQTLYHYACNVTSCTIGITPGTVATFTVDWIAAK